MRWRPLGESAWEIDDLGGMPAWAFAEAIQAAGIAGIVEACPAYDAIALHVDPAVFDGEAALEAIPLLSPVEREPAHHMLPACYEMGIDLEAVALACSVSTRDVARIHSSSEYTCAALGFMPGFAYLGPLAEPLAAIPRRHEPRVRVPAGSVGIAAGQTAVYPSESPGGWALIGRCPLVLADEREGYFPIRPGDRVRFEPIDESRYRLLEGMRL